MKPLTKALIASAVIVFPVNAQQPSKETIGGAMKAIQFQRDRASNEHADCVGDVMDLKARLERAEKELAALKPKPEPEKK